MPALLHAAHGLLGELIIVLRQAAEGDEGTVEGGVIRCGGIDVVGACPLGCLLHGSEVLFGKGEGAFCERLK